MISSAFAQSAAGGAGGFSLQGLLRFLPGTSCARVWAFRFVYSAVSGKRCADEVWRWHLRERAHPPTSFRATLVDVLLNLMR